MVTNLQVNYRYLWRNREVTVQAIEANRVVVQFDLNGEKAMRSLKREELEELPEDDELKDGPYTGFTPEQWGTAKKRADEIAKVVALETGRTSQVEKAAAALNITVRQTWRLVSVYEANPTVSAMMSVACGRPFDLRLLGKEREDVVARCIDEVYRRAERPSLAALRRAVEVECEKLALQTPSPRTLKRRIDRLLQKAVLKDRHGPKVAGEVCDGVPGGVDVKYLLERVEIDHTLIDVILRADTPKREVIGRPWLTVAVDCKSRMILGFYISFSPPGAAAVAMCLAMAALPKDDWLKAVGVAGSWPAFGIPTQIWTDNAMEFRSEALRRGCEEFGIQLCFRPVGSPRYGGIVERLIGTLMGHVHLLPGTTRSSVEDLGDYDAMKRATMTLSEFIPWFTEQVVTQYHLSTHRTLGVSPMAKWQQELPNREIKAPRDALTYYASFLPARKRVLTRIGVQIEQETYWCEQLEPWVGQKKNVLVHYHRMDAGKVYVRLPDGMICTAFAKDGQSEKRTFEDRRRLRQHNKALSKDPDLKQQRLAGFEANQRRLEDSMRKTSTAARAKPEMRLAILPPPAALPPPRHHKPTAMAAVLEVVELD